MSNKAILCFIGMILLVSFVSASLYEVDSLRPQIKVDYDEPVTLTSISLINSTNSPLTLTGPGVPDGPKTHFEYLPQELLKDGEDYTLSITAKDSLGNLKSKEWQFTVKLLPVKLKIIAPPFGVSPTMNYDVLLEANRDVNICKYDNLDFSYERMNNSFEKINSRTLKAENFVGAKTIYARCKDSYGIIDLTSTKLDFRVDESVPLIASFSAEPTLIIEEINGDLQTTLKVETNEPTVCKYSDEEITDYNSVNTDNNNDIHNGFFKGNNESSETTYKTSHQRLLGSYLEGSLSERDYTYYVICRNLAGLFSQPAQTAFSVNLRYPLEITVVSPLEAVNSSTVSMVVKTNKKSTCFYNNNSKQITIPFSSMDKYEHRGTIFISKEGSYTYYISCTSLSSQQAQTSITFLVDLTKPTRPVVNASGACPNSRGLYEANAEWKATDNVSGILKYKYAVGSTQGNSDLVEWLETSNEDEKATNLDLNNTFSIYWSVIAVDKAGNVGPIGDDVAFILGKDDPECFYQANCNNNKKDGDETDIDCGGPQCSKCSLGSFCSLDRDCESGRCINNKCVSSLNQCSNNIKDGNETDIDCGGKDCSPCEIDKECKLKTDCQSNYCKNGKCSSPTCSDNVMNGYETGIDCGGGVCDGCDIGGMCGIHEDCKSNSCQNNICIKATCDDSRLNGLETGIDCGGDCEKCSIGKSCKADEDCISGFCYGGYCEDSSKKDTDKDGLPDGWETQYADCANLDINDPSDASVDSDKDGLTNLEEFQHGTDPCKKDTDSDGYSDGKEVADGYDPLDPNSHPKSSWLFIIILSFILIVLAALAYFVGYPQYKKYVTGKKGQKQPPLRHYPGQPRQPFGIPRARTFFPGERESHERYIQKMREKGLRRTKLFEPFGVKPKLKEPLEKPAEKIKESASELKKPELSEWVPLKELKKIVKPGEQDIFEKLEEINKKVSKKEDVFKELEKIAKGNAVFEKTPVKKSVKERKPVTMSSHQKTILKIASREGKISTEQIKGMYSSSKHAKDVAEHLTVTGYLKPDKEGFFKWTGNQFQEPKKTSNKDVFKDLSKIKKHKK